MCSNCSSCEFLTNASQLRIKWRAGPALRFPESFSNLFNMHSWAINCASALSDGLAPRLLPSSHVEESYRVHLPTNKVISKNRFYSRTVLELDSESQPTDSVLLGLNEFSNATFTPVLMLEQSTVSQETGWREAENKMEESRKEKQSSDSSDYLKLFFSVWFTNTVCGFQCVHASANLSLLPVCGAPVILLTSNLNPTCSVFAQQASGSPLSPTWAPPEQNALA